VSKRKAVPGYVGTSGSEGPHAILREGARIITCAEDLLDDLGLKKEESKREKVNMVRLNTLQSRIVGCLKKERLTPQEIADQLNCSASDVITEISTLEILGVVSREAGNRFYLPVSAGQ